MADPSQDVGQRRRVASAKSLRYLLQFVHLELNHGVDVKAESVREGLSELEDLLIAHERDGHRLQTSNRLFTDPGLDIFQDIEDPRHLYVCRQVQVSDDYRGMWTSEAQQLLMDADLPGRLVWMAPIMVRLAFGFPSQMLYTCRGRVKAGREEDLGRRYQALIDSGWPSTRCSRWGKTMPSWIKGGWAVRERRKATHVSAEETPITGVDTITTEVKKPNAEPEPSQELGDRDSDLSYDPESGLDELSESQMSCSTRSSSSASKDSQNLQAPPISATVRNDGTDSITGPPLREFFLFSGSMIPKNANNKFEWLGSPDELAPLHELLEMRQNTQTYEVRHAKRLREKDTRIMESMLMRGQWNEAAEKCWERRRNAADSEDEEEAEETEDEEVDDNEDNDNDNGDADIEEDEGDGRHDGHEENIFFRLYGKPPLAGGPQNIYR